MIKTLSKVGNSQALILDKTLLELIGVGERGEVELQVQGDTLLIRPAGGGARRGRARPGGGQGGADSGGNPRPEAGPL